MDIVGYIDIAVRAAVVLGDVTRGRDTCKQTRMRRYWWFVSTRINVEDLAFQDYAGVQRLDTNRKSPTVVIVKTHHSACESSTEEKGVRCIHGESLLDIP